MQQWPLDRFAGKQVVFVGAGKGRAMAGVQAFLETHGRLASFTGIDKGIGDRPLAHLLDYDPEQTIFIKNEGIPGNEMPVPYITAMQLFFSLVPLTGAATVGITGTKGKSTTTALTAHILKSAGKQVVLAGNIGISPLIALDEATPATIFVLELSSYQLSDLSESPHISACLNLYNDHTDWHGSLEAYWEAKHNIMRFAKTSDELISYLQTA
jgi:UDP-N-acetylmuramoylalanine-D-glutamate ligase